MPGSERPGAKGGKGGRPYTWEDGYALRHPGAFKAEPVDEDGLFKEEHDANVKAQETFQKFAPKGAGAADRAIADLGLAQTQQQKVCGTARRLAQASHEQHKVIADEYTAAMAPLPLVTSAVGTFFEDAFFGAGGGLTKAIADALAEAAQHEVTAAAPFDPRIGQPVTTPKEKMKAVDEALASARHKVAELVYADALATNEKLVKMFLTQFRAESERSRDFQLYLGIAEDLTESITSSRFQHRDADIPDAVRDACHRMKVAVPEAYREDPPPGSPPAGGKSEPEPELEAPSHKPAVKRSLSIGTDDSDVAPPIADQAAGLKALITKVRERGEEISSSLLMSADTDEDGQLDADEFEELYKDLHQDLELPEPGTQEVSDAWSSVVGGIPKSSGVAKSYDIEAILASMEFLTSTLTERRKKRQQQKRIAAQAVGSDGDSVAASDASSTVGECGESNGSSSWWSGASPGAQER